MKNIEDKKLEEKINKEMGYISGVFMSQGDIKAKDIIMPTTEIREAVDRIMLYVFSTYFGPRQEIKNNKKKMNKPNRTTAIVLALFLGGFGAQKFYMGKPGIGILCLLFCWTGIPSIIALVDIINYLVIGEAKFRERYWGKL